MLGTATLIVYTMALNMVAVPRVNWFALNNPTSNPDTIALGYDVPLPDINFNNLAHPYRKYKVLLDIMDNLNSQVVEKISIGKTQVRHKNIFALRISSKGTTRDDGSPKRKILILGGVHAREWIGVEVAMRIAQRLAERYDNNASARNIETWLLNNTEIWIVPVVNKENASDDNDANSSKTVVVDNFAPYLQSLTIGEIISQKVNCACSWRKLFFCNES